MKLVSTLLPLILFFNCAMLGVLQDKIPAPEFEFESLTIKSITLTDITLLANTSVENPYPISLPSSILEMDLKIEGMKLTHLKTDLGAIEAKKTKQLPIEVKFKYSDLYNLYKKFPDKPMLEVSSEGTMKVPIPKEWQLLGKDSVSFPFVKKKEIPAVLPDVEIKNFKVVLPNKEEIMKNANSESLTNTAIGFLDGLLSQKKQSVTSAAEAGLTGLNLNLNTEFDFVFANKAAADLNLSNLGYDLKLAGENFLNGSPKEIINSGKTSTVKVSTKFPVANISSALYKTIQSHTANFDLKGSSSFNVPNLKEQIPFSYEKKGNFKW
ncbi:LEA type 2 family protein [Leptospira sp. 96542]|nr:LEA type 2 family protein [Leptospira sp. 96542]